MPAFVGAPDPEDHAVLAARQLAAMRAPDKRGLNPLLTLGPLAAQMADAVTTQNALHSGTAHEGNPAMEPLADNPAEFYAVKAGIGLGTGLLANKLAKDGHRGLGKALDVIGIVLPSAVAIANSRK